MAESVADRIEIARGDITKQQVDAIVNAANESLLGGGGVDFAIHAAAGPHLLAECRTLNGCKTGSAKMTKGYNLPAKHVIHAVGPTWRGGSYNEAELLAGCYRTSLQLATDNNLRTIAFPSISTGIFMYPLDQAVRIALTETKAFLENDSTIERVLFVCFDERNYEEYTAAFRDIFTEQA